MLGICMSQRSQAFTLVDLFNCKSMDSVPASLTSSEFFGCYFLQNRVPNSDETYFFTLGTAGKPKTDGAGWETYPVCSLDSTKSKTLKFKKPYTLVTLAFRVDSMGNRRLTLNADVVSGKKILTDFVKLNPNSFAWGMPKDEFQKSCPYFVSQLEKGARFEQFWSISKQAKKFKPNAVVFTTRLYNEKDLVAAKNRMANMFLQYGDSISGFGFKFMQEYQGPDFDPQNGFWDSFGKIFEAYKKNDPAAAADTSKVKLLEAKAKTEAAFDLVQKFFNVVNNKGVIDTDWLNAITLPLNQKTAK